MNVTIDCGSIKTREDLHSTFAQALSFPAWYGKNLDALHDMLTTLKGTIRLENWKTAEAALGRYGAAAARAIAAAGMENTELDILI